MAAVTVADLEILLGADTSEAEQGLSNVNKKVDDLASNPNFDKATVGLMGIGTAGILGFTKSTFAAMDFESSLIDLGIATNTQGADLDNLKMKVLDLGAAFPYSAIEVSNLMTELAKLGYAGEQLDYLTESTLDLSTALGTDLVPTGEAVNAILKSFNMDVSNAGQVADEFYRILAAGSLDMETFMNAWQYLGGIVDQAGLSFMQAGGLLTILTDRAIPAERAGRALKKMFTELMNPSEDLKNMLSSLGIAFSDAEGNMLGVFDIINNIWDSWSGLSKAEKIDLATMLVGTEFMDVAITLFEAGREAWDQFVENYQGAIGIVDAVQMKMASARQIWETFKETIANVSIVVGEQLLPAFKSATSTITNLVDKITTLPAPMLRAIAIGGSLGSAFIFLAGFLGMAAKNIGVVTTGLRILSATALGPVGIVLALAGAFVLAYQHSETFRNIINDLVGVFQSTFGTILESVNNLREAFGQNGIKGVIATLPAELSKAGKAFKTLGTAIKSAFKDVGSLILKSLEPVTSFGSNLLNRLKSQISGMSVGDIFNSLRGTLANALTTALQFVANGASSLLGKITSVINGIDWNNIGSLVAQGLVTVVAAIGGLAALIGTALFDAIRNVSWSELGTSLLGYYKAIFNALIDFTSGFGSTLVSILKSINWSGVWNGLTNAASAAFGWIISAISNIDWGALIAGGWNVIQQGISLAWDAITSLNWNEIIPTFGEWSQWISKKIANLADWGIKSFPGWATYISHKLSDLTAWGIGTFGDWADWLFKITGLSGWGIPTFDGWKSIISNPFEGFSLPEFSWPSKDDILDWIFGKKSDKSFNDDGYQLDANGNAPSTNGVGQGGNGSFALPGTRPMSTAGFLSGGTDLKGIAADAKLAQIAIDGYNVAQVRAGTQAPISFGSVGQASRGNIDPLRSMFQSTADVIKGAWSVGMGAMLSVTQTNTSQMNSAAAANLTSMASVTNSQMSAANGYVNTQSSSMATFLAGKLTGMALNTSVQLALAAGNANTQMTSMATNVGTGAASASSKLGAEAGKWASIITGAGASAIGSAVSVGYNIGAGVAAGLWSALGAVSAAASAIVAQVDRAIRAKAQIHSPSRMFMYHGQMIGEGFIEGISSTLGDITNLGMAMSDAAISSPQMGVPLSGGRYTSLASPSGGGYVINNPTYNVTVHADDLKQYADAGEFFQSLDREYSLQNPTEQIA